MPKIGPFRPLAFKVPSPEVEQLFLQSFARTNERYAQELSTVRLGRLALANINLDVGAETPRGTYAIADVTYDELLKKLTDRKSGRPSDGLLADLAKHYGAGDPRIAALRP